MMMTVITQFDLPTPWSLSDANARFDKSTPKYLGIPGLIRKYFTLTPEGTSAVGVYLWESREHAERFYTEDWIKDQEARIGSKLHMTWLVCPAIADSIINKVIRS